MVVGGVREYGGGDTVNPGFDWQGEDGWGEYGSPSLAEYCVWDVNCISQLKLSCDLPSSPITRETNVVLFLSCDVLLSLPALEGTETCGVGAVSGRFRCDHSSIVYMEVC